MSALGGAFSEWDLRLRSGRLRLRCWGGEERVERLVVCIPGLSANVCSFELIAAGLRSPTRRVVAVDLRGRGRSEATPGGTYGWPAHAADIAELAGLLGADSIDVIGHSMGAYVAMQLAADHRELVDRLVLIDGAGPPETSALELISAGLGRLDRWYSSEEEYIEAIRAAGVVTPWNELWDSIYRYELERRADGQVRAMTSLPAALEDLEYGEGDRHAALWGHLEGPVLLLRANLPLGDSEGFIVSAAAAERFRALVPGAALVGVEANHFGVIADPDALEALVDFLTRGRTAGGTGR